MNWPGREFYGTPLAKAVYRDSEAIVILLLKHGADVNLGSGYYGSALAYAIFEERKPGTRDKYVQLLLDANADVNLSGGGTMGVSTTSEWLPNSP